MNLALPLRVVGTVLVRSAIVGVDPDVTVKSYNVVTTDDISHFRQPSRSSAM